MSTPSTLSPPAATSVTYTSPASASPRETLVTTALTLSSWDTGWTGTLAWSRTCLAYLPAGTSSAARTTFRSLEARSPRVLTPLGLPFSTTMASRLLAKGWGVPTRSLTLPMLAVSAEANRSAGAACWIWVARAWLPAKLKATLMPLAAVNRWPSSVKAAVSDAAANTVSSPGAAEEPPEGSSSPPQPASTRATAATAAARRIRDRSMGPPLARRRLAAGRRRQLDDHVGRLDRGHGQHPRGQLELVGGLPGHQRHHPERPGLELHLGHDLVLGHPGDDPLEPVAGRLGDHLVALGGVPQPGHELGQGGPVDHPLAPLGPPRPQAAGVRPAAYRVHTHPEQLGDLPDPIAWHLLAILACIAASAWQAVTQARICRCTWSGDGRGHDRHRAAAADPAGRRRRRRAGGGASRPGAARVHRGPARDPGGAAGPLRRHDGRVRQPRRAVAQLGRPPPCRRPGGRHRAGHPVPPPGRVERGGRLGRRPRPSGPGLRRRGGPGPGRLAGRTRRRRGRRPHPPRPRRVGAGGRARRAPADRRPGRRRGGLARRHRRLTPQRSPARRAVAADPNSSESRAARSTSPGPGRGPRPRAGRSSTRSP